MKIITVGLLLLIITGSVSAKSNNDLICDGLILVLKDEQKQLSIFSYGQLTNEDKKYALKSIGYVIQISKLMPKYCSVFKEESARANKGMHKLINDMKNRRNEILNN